MTHCLHLIGFRGDEYWSIRRLFPDLPRIIHRIHDQRAHREIDWENDIVVFANDEREDYIHERNAPDVIGFGYTKDGSIFTD